MRGRMVAWVAAGALLASCADATEQSSVPVESPSVGSAPVTSPASVEPQPSTTTTPSPPAPSTNDPATSTGPTTTTEAESLAILRPNGIGLIDFGTAADEAVTELSTTLGPPDVDETIAPLAPGEEDCVEGASWEQCLRANGVLDQGRIVRWLSRGLSAGFTDAIGSAGALTPTPLRFSSWRAVRPAGDDGLTTAEGIGPGSTVGELRVVYAEHRWLFNEGAWDGVLFLITDGEDCGGCVERGIVGQLDYGSEPNGYVRAIQRALNAQGADLAVDGEIGTRTEAAWEQFCADHDLSCSAESPNFPWFITDDQRAALKFPPSDVVVSALVS